MAVRRWVFCPTNHRRPTTSHSVECPPVLARPCSRHVIMPGLKRSSEQPIELLAPECGLDTGSKKMAPEPDVRPAALSLANVNFSTTDDAYFEHQGAYQKNIDTVHDAFVPARGSSHHWVGEIVRAHGGLLGDFWNNGGCNFTLVGYRRLDFFARYFSKLVSLVGQTRPDLDLNDIALFAARLCSVVLQLHSNEYCSSCYENDQGQLQKCAYHDTDRLTSDYCREYWWFDNCACSSGDMWGSVRLCGLECSCVVPSKISAGCSDLRSWFCTRFNNLSFDYSNDSDFLCACYTVLSDLLGYCLSQLDTLSLNEIGNGAWDCLKNLSKQPGEYDLPIARASKPILCSPSKQPILVVDLTLD